MNIDKYNFSRLDEIFNMGSKKDATSKNYFYLSVVYFDLVILSYVEWFNPLDDYGSSVIQHFHNKCDQLVGKYNEKTIYEELVYYDVEREYKFNDDIHFTTIISYYKSTNESWRHYLHVKVRQNIITTRQIEGVNLIMEYLMRRKQTKRASHKY